MAVNTDFILLEKVNHNPPLTAQGSTSSNRVDSSPGSSWHLLVAIARWSTNNPKLQPDITPLFVFRNKTFLHQNEGHLSQLCKFWSFIKPKPFIDQNLVDRIRRVFDKALGLGLPPAMLGRELHHAGTTLEVSHFQRLKTSKKCQSYSFLINSKSLFEKLENSNSQSRAGIVHTVICISFHELNA